MHTNIKVVDWIKNSHDRSYEIYFSLDYKNTSLSKVLPDMQLYAAAELEAILVLRQFESNYLTSNFWLPFAHHWPHDAASERPPPALQTNNR